MEWHAVAGRVVADRPASPTQEAHAMGMFEGIEGYKDKLAEKTGAPVLSVIFVQPRGAAGTGAATMALSRFSPLASMVVNKVTGSNANEKAGGLGKISMWSYKSAILALTGDKLYAFEMKSGWGGLKVKDPIAVWDRSQVKVTGEGKQATTAIDIDVVSTGEHFEVEAMTSFGNDKYILEFFDTLNQSA
jgi:hypothetical protein